MAQFYPKSNFAYGEVNTAPSPATSGTSLALGSGEGTNFPDPATDGQYPIVIWPANEQPTSSNAEIALVTAKSSDTLTITRAQEGTAARTIIVGDQVGMNFTADVANRSTDSEWFKVTQSSHGFAVGNAIRYNGTAWVKAQANAATTLATHIVGAVFDTNNFAAVASGRVTVAAHGLGSAGAGLYLSSATAGLLTSTEPTSYSQLLGYVFDANTLHIGASLRGIVTLNSNQLLTNKVIDITNNTAGVTGKDSGGTSRNILKPTAANILEVGDANWGEISMLARLSNPNIPRVKVKQTTGQAIANATYVTLQFNTEDYDTHTFHDNATNNTRITIPTGLGGTYILIGSTGFPSSGFPAQHQVLFKVNGSYIDAYNIFHYNLASILTVQSLSAGDYVELDVRQETGSSRTTNTSYTSMTAFKIA